MFPSLFFLTFLMIEPTYEFSQYRNVTMLLLWVNPNPNPSVTLMPTLILPNPDGNLHSFQAPPSPSILSLTCFLPSLLSSLCFYFWLPLTQSSHGQCLSQDPLNR